MNADGTNHPETSSERPLQGWKEVAAYLDRDESTARRWEREADLPVRRHRADRRSSVYAYPSEIEDWRAARPTQSETDTPVPVPLWRRMEAWAAVGVGVAAVLVITYGPFLNPRNPVAEAGAAREGVRTVEVCADCKDVGDLSPDGRYFAENDWSGGVGNIAMRGLETGALRRLTDVRKKTGESSTGDAPVFSPDGRWIAYSWETKDAAGEYLVELRVIEARAEDPQPRTVYANSEIQHIYPNAWTQDGRLLVWLKRPDWSNAIGFVSMESGEMTLLKSFLGNVSRPKLSPDERWIAFEMHARPNDPNRDVYLLAADGSVERQVTTHPANDFAMGFTADSEKLLIVSNRTSSYGLRAADVKQTGPSEPHLVLRDIGSVRPITIARDGALVYARATRGVDLYSAQLDLETGKLIKEPHVLATDQRGANDGPWLSPDGRQFIYFASPNFFASQGGVVFRKQVIRLHDRETGRERAVPVEGFDLQTYGGVRWSPHGRRIMTPFRDEQGRWGTCEVDLDSGGVARALKQPALGRSLAPVGWSADGESAIVSINEEVDGKLVGRIEMFGPNATEPQRLHTSNAMIHFATLNPQRNRIAWRESFYESTAPPRIKVMSLDRGEPEVVFQAPILSGQTPPAWTPDSESLLVTIRHKDWKRQPNEIWVVPLDGSGPRKTELQRRAC